MQVMFDTISSSFAHIKAGKLRALGVERDPIRRLMSTRLTIAGYFEDRSAEYIRGCSPFFRG